MPRKPGDFHGFVGQAKIVARVRKQLSGAKSLGEICSSILLIGPSGAGKTEFARAIAKETGGNFIEAHGQDTLGDLAVKILAAKPGDILFIDEIHAAKARAQEVLYGLIDSERIPRWAYTEAQRANTALAGLTGEFAAAPRIMLILATDQPGRLLNALVKRMQIHESFQPYGIHEMRAIIDRLATDRAILLTPQASNAIARVSWGLPRIARHHLQNLRRYFAAVASAEINSKQVQRFLRSNDVDEQGLGPQHRLFLRSLEKLGKASIESLAQRLGADVDYVRRTIEPQLTGIDMVRIRSGGRELTPAGRQWLATLKAHRDARQQTPIGEE